MTDEQIRQDAIRYVGANYDKEQLDLLLSGETQPHPVNEEPLIRAYIAGAHSRDEEIKDVANDCRARLNNYERQLCEARDDVKKWREEYENKERENKFWHDLYCSNYDEMRSYMGFIRGFFWDVKVSGFRTALKELFQKKED